MNIIYLLIGISFLFLILITVIFFWSVRSGQFDDLEKHSHQILMDNENKKEDS